MVHPSGVRAVSLDWFQIEVNPVPWKVGPLNVVRKNGKMIPTMGKNQEVADYQAALKSALARMETRFYDGPVELQVFFWRRIEAYKTTQARTARNQEADATNLLKSTEDALHDIFYKNDKDNHIVRAIIVRQDDRCQGKVVIGIRSMALDEKFDALKLIPQEVLDGTKFETLDPEDAKWAALRASDEDDF